MDRASARVLCITTCSNLTSVGILLSARHNAGPDMTLPCPALGDFSYRAAGSPILRRKEHANLLPTLSAYGHIGPVTSGATFGLRRRGTH